MGFFRTAFSRLSMAMTGKVISQIDTPITDGQCQMSLRLKRKNDNSEAYVVVAGIAQENCQYYPMNSEEFGRFADAVQNMRSQLSKANGA